ncbi:MAG: hypothetical protein IKY91_08385 [Akkermansia sp.]|nr:hypothetical protein [Akkermansia sp.]
MNTERTIKICGVDVALRYCAATETGYESMTDKPIGVFIPTIGKDEEGKDVIVKPAAATMRDYLYLALAAIVAAYGRRNENAPLDSKEILYDATPEEVTLLVTTVAELRNEWYAIPASAKDENDNDHEKPADPNA